MAKETRILGGGGAAFPDTPWSTILAGARKGAPLAPALLESLARLYWRPVYFWFRYRWNCSPEDAKDLTQDLYTSLMTSEAASSLDPGRGRLRVYLKTVADNLVRHRARDAKRQKRGGGRPAISLEEIEDSLVPAPTDNSACERGFDAEWAKCLIDRSLQMLAERLALAGKEGYVEVLKCHDLATAEVPSYEEMARRFDLTVDQVRNHLRYARSLLRSVIREVVHQSLSDPAEVDDELAVLFGGMPSGRPPAQ